MNPDQIHEMNDAVGRNDLDRFAQGLHPDIAWDHNLGTGSPEEGSYRGREEVIRLFGRVLEGWEYIRPEATAIDEVEPGKFHVRGVLHCKHSATEVPIVEQYEQHMEFREGLLTRGRMTMGTPHD